jgi:hypothetical protein
MWREGEGKPKQGRNHPRWGLGAWPKGGLRADLAETAGQPRGRPVPGRPLQELGTIEAGSKVEITGPSKA